MSLVQSTSPGVYYTDPLSIMRRVGSEGFNNLIKDFGQNAISGESYVIEDAIYTASDTINQYLFSLYMPSNLQTSYWVKSIATDLAVYELFTRRGNSAPGNVERRRDLAIDKLEKARLQYIEPGGGIPLRFTQSPAWSSVRYDLRYSSYRIRIETGLSDRSVISYPRSPDYSMLFDPII